MSLKAKIKNMLDENRGLAIEIAKKAGFKNATPLYKFLSEPDREMDSFNSLLTIVRELFDNEKHIMGEYIKTLDPCKSFSRTALEYTQINKMYDIHAVLIAKMKQCKNAESKEWAFIYDTDYKYTFKVVSASDTVSEIIMENPKKIEMKAYASLLKAYCYYEMECGSLLEESVKLCRLMIPQIKDSFLRNSYTGRLSLLASVSNFNLGNIEASRTYAEFGLEAGNNESVNRWIHLSLGNTYLLEDYETSFNHLNKCLEVSINNGFEDSEEEAKKSINFLNILSNRKPIYTIKDEVSRIHQEAFWSAREGSLELAKKKLDEMNKESMTNIQLAFHNYYLGIVTKNKSYILKSLKLFKKCKSLFYLQLPALELQKMGIDSDMIEAMIA